MSAPPRSRRRSDRERMVRKARRLYPDHPKATHYADHLAVCSCPMCGNPRRYRKERLTIQERRADVVEPL